MTSPEPRRRYALARVRLINFHNFVDETVCIPDAGHLFLLGDNASGKTTLLDALHLALSGGEGLEWNAAARVGGRRSEGRSLAGIVLRQDAERGVRNLGGAVAYAVVELRAEDGSERHLCVGVGMQATTMDSGVTRWGVVAPRSLDELPLTEEDEEGRPCPLGREELRARLDRRELFGHMTDYRRAVAERLFGGAEPYEEVCRFWSMAKAYREIVAGARDFESLFTRLLPAPEAGVFHEILRSLRELSELGVQLEGLREQRAYVQAALETCRAIGARREESARYEWLRAHVELLAEDEALRAIDFEQRARQETTARLAAEVEVAQAALAAADAALREAEAEDEGGLFEKLARAQRELDARLAERREHDARAHAASRRVEDAERALRSTRQTWADALDVWRDRTEVALEAAAELPTELSALQSWLSEVEALSDRLRLADMEHGLVRERPPRPQAEVETECDQLSARARERERAASDALALARASLGAAEEALAMARAGGEVRPEVADLERALALLAEAGITARPLYLSLEPRRDALSLHLAALEALAGDETLGAVWVSAEDRPRASDLLAREAPEVRLFLREAGARSPDWVARLLKQPKSPDEQAAMAALASALQQPASLGEVEAPNALAALELRGLGFRLARELPRYLGAQARERERRRRVEVASEAHERAQREVTEAERGASWAADRVARAAKLGRCARAVMSEGALLEAAEQSEDARRELSTRREHAQRAREAQRRAMELEAQAREVHAALDARAQALEWAELSRKLEALRARKTRAGEVLEQAQRGLGGEQARAEQAQVRRLEHELARSRHQESLEACATALRAQLDEVLDAEALAHYVLVRQRGRQFTRRENLDARLEESRRAQERLVVELSGDGSAGVRNVRWAARFGFGWDETNNALRDRRGEPAQGVLAELERTVAEQESVIHEGTRELMERLIMGSLLRHLRAQVSALDRLLRDINRLLAELRFGRTRYQFRVTPRADRKQIVETVRKVSLLDEESRGRFRAFVEDRMDELRGADDDTAVPELLDYRRWYDYRLTMRTAGDDDVELSRELRQLGSGGEQGVPNYLLVLALAKLMFDSTQARVRPVFFDEAFYGIDAMRRDELLRFATELGLQVVVASPDQDGVTRAVNRSTTLFVLKDELGDVHLAPYDYENHAREAQPSLFDEGPEESPAHEASCETSSESANY